MKTKLLIKITDPERLKTLREDYARYEMALMKIDDTYYAVVPIKKKKKDDKKRTDRQSNSSTDEHENESGGNSDRRGRTSQKTKARGFSE